MHVKFVRKRRHTLRFDFARSLTSRKLWWSHLQVVRGPILSSCLLLISYSYFRCVARQKSRHLFIDCELLAALRFATSHVWWIHE